MTRRAKIIHNGKGCDVSAGYRYVLVEESPTNLRPLKKSDDLLHLQTIRVRMAKKDASKTLFIADLKDGTLFGLPEEKFEGDPNVWEKFGDGEHWRLGTRATIGRVSPRGGKHIFALRVPPGTNQTQWFDRFDDAKKAAESCLK